MNCPNCDEYIEEESNIENTRCRNCGYFEDNFIGVKNHGDAKSRYITEAKLVREINRKEENI